MVTLGIIPEGTRHPGCTQNGAVQYIYKEGAWRVSIFDGLGSTENTWHQKELTEEFFDLMKGTK